MNDQPKVADVKAVLTEALREAMFYRSPEGELVFKWSDQRIISREGGSTPHGDPCVDDAAEALATAVLALPGVAVIQLPQPDEGPDGEGQFMFRSPVSTVSVTPGGRVWDEDFDMTASEASDHAAVLLAAAVLSEETTK